jgi:hypothetical protein
MHRSKTASLDHLVGGREQRRRRGQAEHLGRLEIDYQRDLGWRLYPQARRVGGVAGGSSGVRFQFNGRGSLIRLMPVRLGGLRLPLVVSKMVSLLAPCLLLQAPSNNDETGRDRVLEWPWLNISFPSGLIVMLLWGILFLPFADFPALLLEEGTHAGVAPRPG